MAVGTHALTTLADVKAYLGLSDSFTDHDALLEGLIDAITATIERFCKRKLKARDYSYDEDSDDYDSDNAVLDGNGRDRLLLPQYPGNSVTTVRINELAIDQSTGVYVTGWVLDRASGVLYLRGYRFTRGLQNVELAYNAGYASVPDDLAQAAIAQTAWVYKEAPKAGNLLGVQSKTMPDGSVSYSSRALLPAVKAALAGYTRREAL